MTIDYNNDTNISILTLDTVSVYGVSAASAIYVNKIEHNNFTFIQDDQVRVVDRTRAHTHTYAHTHARTRTHTRTHAYACRHARTHIYTRMHIRTHTHIH